MGRNDAGSRVDQVALAVLSPHRGTVAEALKVLEWAGVLTWQHRIARVRERCRDLWGREGWRWRVVRTSNAYVRALQARA